MKDGVRYMMPYAAYTAIIMFIAIIGFYMIGIPIGIGTFPGVSYGA
jgi:p-aminobenzoyl-glutamate transporter AbgT